MDAGLSQLLSLPRLDLVFLVGVPLYWISALLFFSARCAVRGEIPRSQRFEQIGGKRVVPRLFLEFGYWQLNLQVKLLIKLGLTANMVTVLSLVLATAGAYYIGIGRFSLGGWLMFIGFFCDAFDGLIARATNTSCQRGEYFDSFVDRYADLITSFGYLWYYRDDRFVLLLIALGMLGSTAMGYAKAKGAAFGVDTNIGVMQRHERAVWLGVSTVLAPIIAAFAETGSPHPRFHIVILALGVIAVLSNVSAIWRAAHVMTRLPGPGEAPASAPAKSADRAR